MLPYPTDASDSTGSRTEEDHRRFRRGLRYGIGLGIAFWLAIIAVIWLAVHALAAEDLTVAAALDHPFRPLGVDVRLHLAQTKQPVLSGIVWTAIDGDTIAIDGVHVRLQGVAAPELSDPGGQEAKIAMIRLVAGYVVRCELDGTRSHERVVGICYLGDLDIGGEMVRQGLARDCPRFSGGRYAALEAAAPGDISETYALPSYCR